MPDLTGLPALDLAIGLAFVFFLIATLASAIQELLASFYGLRARTLEQGLRSLLEDDDQGWELVDRFYDHPLVKSLYRTPLPKAVAEAAGGVAAAPPAEDAVGRNAATLPLGTRDRAKGFFKRTAGPSYVSPRAFATFMLDNIAPGTDTKTVFDNAEHALSGLPKQVQERLRPLIDNAEGSVEQLRTNIEAWYDDTMARVSGWYKRKTQVILLVIGAVLVLVLNVNTLTIGNRLWKDTVVRTAVVQQADAVLKSAPATAKPDPDPVKAAADKLDQAAKSVDDVGTLAVPIGWRGAAVPHGWGWLFAIVGWLLTIAAISLGAPFWFDLLGRFSRLRSSGKPETPLPATASGRPNERIKT